MDDAPSASAASASENAIQPLLSRLLPLPEDPVPGVSFYDRCLLLLAGAVHADGVLTYRHYRLVQEACRLILGEQALHARLQAKLHFALLNPPDLKETRNLARRMATQVHEEGLPSSSVNALMQALNHVLPTDEVTENARRLLPELESTFRRDGTEAGGCSWDSLREKGGFDVESRLSELCRKAARQLRHMGLLADGAHTASASSSGYGSDSSPDAATSSALDASRSADPDFIRTGLEQPVRALENMASVLHDAEFLADLSAMRTLMRSQPCRIVVVGESKRGKSSVVNALLGLHLTPMREAAHTGTVLRLQRAKKAEYRAFFHSASQLERLQRAVEQDPGDTLLARSLEQIRRGLADSRFIPGSTHTLSASATSTAPPDHPGLGDFLRADGLFGGLVCRVEADLEQSVLGENVILSDTPGINHLNPFLAELALAEAMEADCVVFVMDARSPGSASELNLLRRLAARGRTISLIGVLTHTDELEEAGSTEWAREQARAVLHEACRASQHVRLSGVVLVNAKEAAKERCRPEGTLRAPSGRCGEFATLFTLLREALDLDADKSRHRGKVAENYHTLALSARRGLRRHMEDSLSRMPGPELLAMLEAHAAQLHEATRLSMEQARQVVRATLDDLDAWERATERSLNRFTETLVLRLMEAVNAKVTAQGRNFAKASTWQSFDNTEAQSIARETVEGFLVEQREILAMWEAKLRLFSRRMDECTRVCLAGTSALGGLDAENVMAPEAERATHFLVQTHHYMKSLAVFATGAAIGRATMFSPLAVVLSAGNMLALAIASPMIAAVVAAMAGTAGIMYHLGREDKRRAAFMERRRREAEAYAARVSAALREELRRARTDITTLYESEVHKGFSPALDSLYHQSAHLRLFLDTMHAIRADVVRCDTEAQQHLKTLAEALSRKGIELT